MKAVSVLLVFVGLIAVLSVPSVVRANEDSDAAAVEVDQSALYGTDAAVGSDNASDEEEAHEFSEIDEEAEAEESQSVAVDTSAEDSEASFMEIEAETEDEADEEADAEEETEDESEESEEDQAEEEADAASFAEVQGADACLAGWNSAKASALGAAAARMQASYKAQGVTYSQPQRSFGPRPSTKKSDCSGFVTSVLDSVGADCLFAAGRNTAAMRPLMVARGGFHQVPKVGDIVMWGSHTGLITNKACPAGKAELAAMGVHGCAASGCITVASMKGWGSGGWLGFWTPKSIGK